MWALRFEQVHKRYPPAGPSYRSLRQELAGGWRRRSGSATPTGFAALRDVSFAVEEGESCALIGPTGAGKSTALRLAARVTAPTSGTVGVRGRMGALIEVGAGIHPELTGRENIWLYGAILGLSRAEIAQRFDAIVAFAELAPVLDWPVKRYSSGMQLRLGFAIAAGVEPDVLVVDEALAVGDARFQLRCLDRMAELVRSGTTVVYVSHDLATVESACTRAILLVDGAVVADGAAGDTVAAYLRWVEQSSGAEGSAMPEGAAGDDGRGGADILDGAGRSCRVFAPGDRATIVVPLPVTFGPVTVALGIRDGHPWNVLGASVTFASTGGATSVRCDVDSLPLQGGVYQVFALSAAPQAAEEGRWVLLGSFRVVDPDATPRPPWLPTVRMGHSWQLQDDPQQIER